VLSVTDTALSAATAVTVTLVGLTMGIESAGGNVSVLTEIDSFPSSNYWSSFIGGTVMSFSFFIVESSRVANATNVSVTFGFTPSAGGELAQGGVSQVTLVYPFGFFLSGVTPSVSVNPSADAFSSASNMSSIVITLRSGTIAANVPVLVTLRNMTMGRDGTIGGAVNCSTTRDPLFSNSTASGTLNCSSPAGNYCPEVHNAYRTCPAGFYCPNSNMRQGIECERGAYCVAGQAIYTNCSAGFFNPDRGMQNETAGCRMCNPGHFCGPDAGQFNQTGCRSGTFNNESGARDSSACQGCHPGQFCPPGSSLGIDCPAGTFNKNTNSTTIGSCTPCSAGKFNHRPGMSSESACERCPVDTWSYENSSGCEECAGGGLYKFTREGDLATSPSDCRGSGWLNVMSDTNIIVFCLIIFFCGVFCLYCLYLDRKKPGFSHLPLFFASMSLIEICGFAWVLSDFVRLFNQARANVWSRHWRFPWTQGTFVSFLLIYGLSYVFNFFASHLWTKQVSDDL
jgi:hypothetical protein